MKQITLTKGKFALVDDEDYDYLMQWKWYYSTGYAMRTEKKNGIKKTILMHRIVNKTPDGIDTDHWDRNRLNNQKYNLRDATTSQNSNNAAPAKGFASPYKGVGWDKNNKKWIVRINFSMKSIFLGRFSCEKKAAIAYNKKALELFGDFAFLNIIDDQRQV